MDEIEVIVIGGSAGALDALLVVLAALPAAFAIPIVVVIHLSPAQPSLVPALLARASGRPVHEIEDKLPLERGAVYVAPPNYHALLESGGTLALSVDDPVHHSRPSIDVLFESAAEAYGPALAGVVLSGSNEDGADGLRRIRERGGIAIVEAPATAVCPAMPAAALDRAGPGVRAVPAGELAGCLERLPGGTRPVTGGSP
jgi:two-component system chemotaxis response regulator CheB